MTHPTNTKNYIDRRRHYSTVCFHRNLARPITGILVVERRDDKDRIGTKETLSEFELERRIREKVRKRMNELAVEGGAGASQLNPDVIVISGDQTFLFEPQNSRASSWLHKRYGLETENHGGRERIRVHPCESPKIVADLKAAGFAVIT
jgi:hypothetical protein